METFSAQIKLTEEQQKVLRQPETVTVIVSGVHEAQTYDHPGGLYDCEIEWNGQNISDLFSDEDHYEIFMKAKERWASVYVAVGTYAMSVVFSKTDAEIRRPNKDFIFRGRTMEQLEGTDFWNLESEEIENIVKNTTLLVFGD